MDPCERQRSSPYNFLSLLLYETSLGYKQVKTIQEKENLFKNVYSSIPL